MIAPAMKGAMLMNRLFTEGLIDDEKQSFIKNTLKEYSGQRLHKWP